MPRKSKIVSPRKLAKKIREAFSPKAWEPVRKAFTPKTSLPGRKKSQKRRSSGAANPPSMKPVPSLPAWSALPVHNVPKPLPEVDPQFKEWEDELNRQFAEKRRRRDLDQSINVPTNWRSFYDGEAPSAPVQQYDDDDELDYMFM